MRHRSSRMETGTEHRTPARASAQPGDLAHRGRAHRDHRHQGQGHAPARREDDHAGQARRCGRAPPGRSYLMTREAVDKLFDTISPRFGDRDGGYTAHHSRPACARAMAGRWPSSSCSAARRRIDEKREKRAEARAKRAEETRKAMEEAQAQQQQGGETPEGGSEPKA